MSKPDSIYDLNNLKFTPHCFALVAPALTPEQVEEFLEDLRDMNASRALSAAKAEDKADE